MLQLVVLVIAGIASSVVTLIKVKAIRAKNPGQGFNTSQDEQNLHIRYSFGEFHHEEYKIRLEQLRLLSLSYK